VQTINSATNKESWMKGKGPRDERETIINFNEAEPCASIWTASEPMYRKLLKLGYEPIEGSDRSATFEVPKRLVAIASPGRSAMHTAQSSPRTPRLLRSGTVITEAEQADEPQQ
jgi:hypothetical protein